MLQERLLDEIGERGLLENDGADVASAVKDFAARALASEEIALNEAERVRLAAELTDATIGMGAPPPPTAAPPPHAQPPKPPRTGGGGQAGPPEPNALTP